jgi:hypothetical protein
MKAGRWGNYDVYAGRRLLNICFREKLLEWIKFTQSNTKWVKSACRATKFQGDSNEKFGKCDNAGSLASYTGSVVHEPRDAKELSLALANRSAALLHLGTYQVYDDYPFHCLAYQQSYNQQSFRS